jgi:hypothetical protein
LEFRPLIEHGIVALLPPVFHCCPKCFKDLVPRGDQILEVKEELLEENVGNFSVGYDPGPTKRAPYGRLIVEGPPVKIESRIFVRRRRAIGNLETGVSSISQTGFFDNLYDM